MVRGRIVRFGGDFSGIAEWAGVVDGFASAMEDKRTQGAFVDGLIGSLQGRFMVDILAAKNSGLESVKHMFEWGNSQGDTSDIPLFKLVSHGTPTQKNLTFTFLPSKRLVPLPDPAKYGFDPEILSTLSRHTFSTKAITMEYHNAVVIEPVMASKLFIPTSSSEQGYIMTSKPVTINPGGSQSTGGFTAFWSAWFDTTGMKIIQERTYEAERFMATEGRRVMRYKAGTKVGGRSVGGQFVGTTKASLSVTRATAASAKNILSRKFQQEFGKYSYGVEE